MPAVFAVVDKTKTIQYVSVVFEPDRLELRRQLLGEHEETAFSLGNLGVALASDGQWHEAAESLQAAVEMYDRLGLGNGEEAQGYKKNLEVCLQAMADTPPTA